MRVAVNFFGVHSWSPTTHRGTRRILRRESCTREGVHAAHCSLWIERGEGWKRAGFVQDGD